MNLYRSTPIARQGSSATRDAAHLNKPRQDPEEAPCSAT